MSRIFAQIALLLASFSILSACGSPFVKGWRNDQKEERTDQEKCEAMKGYQWLNGSCQKEGSFNLDGLGEADCKKVETAVWKDNHCIAFADLKTAADCSSVGWKWSADRCMLPAEAECLADPASDWVTDHCVVRPTLALTGSTTQMLTLGGVFQPLTVTLSADALLSLENQSCAGFFTVNAAKITSIPATDSSSCEADAVAVFDGAKSKPVHLTATIDKGFASYCKKFQDQAAASKERLLARTVFLLKAASGKDSCDDAAADLAKVTNLDISSSALVDLRPLAGLSALSVLNLEDNDVVDLTPIAYLPNLTVIKMAGNPLGTTVKLTAKNCPTKDVNFGVLDFCLGR